MSTSAARSSALPASLISKTSSAATSEVAAPTPARQKETAQYIADMILELRNMAKSVRLFQVMVPLEYAYYEAFGIANRVDVPPGEADRLREISLATEERNQAEDY